MLHTAYKLHSQNKNESLATAKRPCGCSVLCLRPKSSLCSCLYGPHQRICKPPKAARMETNGPTGDEKRNLGQICHSLVCRCTEPAGSTMPLISLEHSDTES